MTAGPDSPPGYRQSVDFALQYVSVATLADDPAGLTCSVSVAHQWARGRASSVVGYPRFEIAAESVRSGEHDVLLVPSAYPEIRTFFFDPMLRAAEAFVGHLPDMVFAVPPGGDPDAIDVLFHHPATQTLVAGLPEPLGRVVTVTSNSLACRDALASTERAAAITNSTSADHYGLATVRVLSPSTPMAFVVFTGRTPAT